MNKIITIHQPDFWPWIGFFNKINKADEFVLLDHTLNNPRDSAFFCRRVSLLIEGKSSWITIPLEKDSSRVFVPINEMKIKIAEQKNLESILRSIKHNYSKHPYFKDTFPLIENYFNHPSLYLAERNFAFIESTLHRLDIDKTIVRSSELNCTQSSNELLIEIIKKRNGSVYLCGGGAGKYQNDQLFHAENIQVQYNSFENEAYSQLNSTEFIKGLSIIDLLMNVGFDQAKSVVNKSENKNN